LSITYFRTGYCCFVLLSGYNIRPSEKDYWNETEDLKAECVQQLMPKNRYMKLKSVVHFVDNKTASQHSNDPAFKIRPILDGLNAKFGIFVSALSIDAIIVRYYEHHGLKQFIHGKPIWFGYKYWAVCGNNGYCFSFQLYCGKETSQGCQNLPLGTRVVLSLLDVIPPSDRPSNTVYFYNFFTSYNLLGHLSKMSIRATGTVRQNRTGHCPLIPVCTMAKGKRGSFDHCCDQAHNILMVRWYDNSVVTMTTNCDTVQPTQFSRWCLAKGGAGKTTVELMCINLVLSQTTT